MGYNSLGKLNNLPIIIRISCIIMIAKLNYTLRPTTNDDVVSIYVELVKTESKPGSVPRMSIAE